MSHFLLDTNVLSEIRKGVRGFSKVTAWYSNVPVSDVFISVITIGEMLYGAHLVRKRDPVKAMQIDAWCAETKKEFETHIIGVDLKIMEQWAKIAAVRTIPAFDAVLAATAKVHNLIVATRNTADFDGTGVLLFNPFD